MVGVLLSEAEKTFILHGVEENLRCDGRTREEYRPMELETDIVSHASGSARLRLANTDILVGVKTEIDVPFAETPYLGKIEFFVDCSANATPEFEGRGGEELGAEISHALSHAYNSSQAFDLNALCIMPGHQCWKLYVDILILECGGNLFDAVSLAVKGALYNTRIPKVTAAVLDGGNVDLQLSDDPFESERLDVLYAPLLITLCKIGDYCVVDPSAEEEKCSPVSLVIGIRGDSTQITCIRTAGSGSLSPMTLKDSIRIGCQAGLDLHNALMEALKKEESIPKRKPIGFLK